MQSPGCPTGRTWVCELKLGRLIKKLQHVWVVLHRVDSPQFYGTAFKLDAHAHFAALIAYLFDDVHRQAQIHHYDEFHTLVDEAMQQILMIVEEQDSQLKQPQRSLPLSLDNVECESQKPIIQSQRQEQFVSPHLEAFDTLQQLFVLMERFRKHPELVAVTNDFLQEVTGS